MYYGVFSELIKLGPEMVQEIGLYEGYFAENYDRIIGSYSQELDIYLENACVTGGKVLELACGTGRILVELAKQKCRVKGIELSDSMLSMLEERVTALRPRIRNLIEYEKADVWQYEPDEKYGMVIIPATTICYFVDDLKQTVELFKRIYDMLEDGGRLVFDYRCDQNEQVKSMTKLEVQREEDGFVLYQEFDNYVPKKSIVNFYAERIEGDHTARYMTSSLKRIVTDEMISHVIKQTEFTLVDEHVVELGEKERVKYIILQKGGLV